jgi:hypothetical protein
MRNWRSGSRRWSAVYLLGTLGLIALLAGCGAAAGNSAATLRGNSQSSSQGAPGSSAGAASVASSSGASGSSSSQASNQPPTAQYLIKSLSVNMTSPDPRKTAADLQSWILTTDPKAASAGMTYMQDGASYDVALTFNVEASVYPQIESYLAGYAQGHGGKLINLQETVQDVTNDYVDSQSRLTNLRGEQQRLLTLMGQAQSLNDVLTIEQRLTDVEGQIEDIQAHIALLSGQTTFYTVRIQLSPLGSATIAAPEPWNPGQVFQQALGAALIFGQALLTLFIWLGVFGIYIVPVVGVYWIGRRLIIRRRMARASSQKS